MVYADLEMLGMGKFRIKNSYLSLVSSKKKLLTKLQSESDVDTFRKNIYYVHFLFFLFSITVS